MKQVLKENMVLVAGIALPLILCVLFFMAQKISVMGIAPPQTAVVFSDQPINTKIWSFDVREGTLHLLYSPEGNVDYWNPPTLYVFDPKSGNVTPHKIPTSVDKKKSAEIVLDGLKDIKISTESVSPDGYVFFGSYYSRGGGLMTEMFSGGYNRYNPALKNKGMVVRIPTDQNVYSATFVGWVTP